MPNRPWLIENINKIDKLLARLTKIKTKKRQKQSLSQDISTDMNTVYKDNKSLLLPFLFQCIGNLKLILEENLQPCK